MYLNLDLSGLLFLVFQISSSSVRKIENTNNNKIKQTYVKGKIFAISQAAIHNDAHYFEHGLLISRISLKQNEGQPTSLLHVIFHIYSCQSV